MAAWPDVEELKNVRDIGDSQFIDEQLQRNLEGAIIRVKRDVGDWDEDVDEPDANLGQAALRAAVVLTVNAPDDGWRVLDKDHIYQALLKGYRRTFGIA